AREINTLRPALQAHETFNRQRRTLVHLLGVLGLDVREPAPREAASIEPYVNLLVEVRRKLREIKQWALSDEIRDRLTLLGVSVEDRPGGESTWRIER
ncbi:MAG: CysS/YqeB C-terminal domain-containing protein, partial [Chloroflexota bacterium]